MKKHFCRPLLIPFASCVFLAMAGVAAHAAAGADKQPALPVYTVKTESREALAYHIYAGGFDALDAELVLDLTPQNYEIELSAKTKGFIGTLFPWSGAYSTVGHAEKNGPPVPRRSTNKSVWRSNLKTTEMEYADDGTLKKSIQLENGKTTVTDDFTPELAKGAVDMLTSTLMMMQSAEINGSCKGSFPVFDGKRRFNITLQDEGPDTIAPNKYSIFSGAAQRCTLVVEPVAGFRKKDMKRGWMAVQNHTEGYKKLPTLWFARLVSDGPVVPVRMEIASEYGAVVAHLAQNR